MIEVSSTVHQPSVSSVAFLLPSIGVGGQERMTLKMTEELLTRGFEAEILVCRVMPDRPEWVREGDRVTSLAAPTTLRAIPRLARRLQDSDFDWLVPISTQATVVAVEARRRSSSRVRIAASVRNFVDEPYGSAWRHPRRWVRSQVVDRLLGPRALRRADEVMAVSADLASALIPKVRRAGGTVHHVRNPACPERVPEASSWQEIDARLGFLEGSDVAIAVGRLVPAKGIDVLLAALVLEPRLSSTHLLIVGDGPERATLERRTMASGLRGRVHFMGSIPDPLPYIQAAGVLVAPSRFEGFGNVLVEALAVGTNVVSSLCRGGPKEILSNGEHGWLVPPEDPHALAVAIADAFAAPVPAEKLTAAARRYSSAAAVDDLLAVLESHP